MEQRYVGIDLHRRRSVIYTMDAEGEKLSCVRIANEPSALMAAVAPAGDGAHVVIEATYGWYWAVDLLRDNGFDVHLAHPSGNDWGKRRVKNDERDARDLADLLRLGRLAEAWIAPGDGARAARARALPGQAREPALGTQDPGARGDGQGRCAAQRARHVRARGRRQLDALQLAEPYTLRIESLRDLVPVYDREIVMLERKIQPSRPSTEWAAPSTPSSVPRSAMSPASAPRPRCALGGARPPSPGVGHQGGAGQHHQDGLASGALGGAGGGGPLPRGTWLHEDFCGIAERRGKKKARVAVAHKMLTLVYCGLRDGEIRCLRDRQAA